MLIDDDNFNLLALKKILLKLCNNLEVSTYQNGLDALAYFKREYALNIRPSSRCMIDLIIVDINMPFINGYKFAIEMSRLQ